MINRTTQQLAIELLLKGDVLRICDTSLYFDSGIELMLHPGSYRIEEIVDELGESQGLNVASDGPIDGSEFVDEITFPFGQFGFFDKMRVDECFAKMPEMEVYFSQLQSESPYGVVSLSGDVLVPFFRCAEGAAVVSRLLVDNRVVGFSMRYGFLDEEATSEAG